MSTTQRPYHDHAPHWPPELIAKLRATHESQIDTNPQHVSIVIHETKCPYNDNTYEILGVFSSTFIANQTAMDFFKDEYSNFMEELSDDGPWGHFYEKPTNMDMNTVAWSVSNSGRLRLKALDGGDGDLYQVYVKRMAIQSSYSPRVARRDATQSAHFYDFHF
ncbi:hypothetical protein N7466_007782 [Penicillium verhagenii]|uniref:uncharacterized protein n=1 Tax=Penicillium verhagenii TaxID=1562060 RepID=UPI002544FE1E|nr:uncharacterized protein N7466_007782 [Penicillium verhagenii]KAJ5928826.1 hypothetical protein N7466_007782 [Penicillium verhagenii]